MVFYSFSLRSGLAGAPGLSPSLIACVVVCAWVRRRCCARSRCAHSGAAPLVGDDAVAVGGAPAAEPPPVARHAACLPALALLDKASPARFTMAPAPCIAAPPPARAMPPTPAATPAT